MSSLVLMSIENNALHNTVWNRIIKEFTAHTARNKQYI